MTKSGDVPTRRRGGAPVLERLWMGGANTGENPAWVFALFGFKTSSP